MEGLFDYQGEYFDLAPAAVSLKQLVENLKSHFATVRPVPISWHGQKAIFVHLHLIVSSRAFVGHDTNHSNLHMIDHSRSYSKVLKPLISTSEIINRLFISTDSNQLSQPLIAKPLRNHAQSNLCQFQMRNLTTSNLYQL